MKDLKLDDAHDQDEQILGSSLFSEFEDTASKTERKAKKSRAAKPVDVEDDEWGDDETVVDLMAEKEKRAARPDSRQTER